MKHTQKQKKKKEKETEKQQQKGKKRNIKRKSNEHDAKPTFTPELTWRRVQRNLFNNGNRSWVKMLIKAKLIALQS